MSEFRIQQCLGRGGFGEVYKAVMSRGGGIDVDVAIKVLRPDLDPDNQGVKRLKDEGNLLGRLTHPTILRVYGMVEVEGRSALVTEYVGGDDLGRLIRSDVETAEPGSGIPARAAFEIIAQVAAALDAAWSWPSVSDGKPFHLVHRDIKPDNIRIDPHGSVKLLDFGISLASSVRREAHTSVNTIMGSTQYLAPERLVMQEVGPESDVFALGCTLFEALTGEALFARKSMRQMYMLMVDEHRFDEFVTERCTACRDRLGGDRSVALVRAMTAWRKANRPTAAEVAARCDMISDSTQGTALTQWCRARKWPPTPTIEGGLEGHSFVVSQPLAEENVATDALRPPGQFERVQLRSELDDTTGSSFVPFPTDDTTDARLRTEEQRPSVLGELGHRPNSQEAEVSRSASAEGSLPWSEAEMVALWGESDGPASLDREEPTVRVIDTTRLPQLLRQHPDEALPAAQPAVPTRANTAPLLPDPAPLRPDPAPLLPDPAALPADPAPLLPESLPAGTSPLPTLDEPSTTSEGPSAAAVPPAPATGPTEPPAEFGGDASPPSQEEPTVRLPRRTTHTGMRVSGGRSTRRNPLPVTLDPATGPIPDLIPEPTLRLVDPPEHTLELSGDAQEQTLPGVAPDDLVPRRSEWEVDEVQQPLGPEPDESSGPYEDPDESNTDADGIPVGRALRPSEEVLGLPPARPPPAQPPPAQAAPTQPTPTQPTPTQPPPTQPLPASAAPDQVQPPPRVSDAQAATARIAMHVAAPAPATDATDPVPTSAAPAQPRKRRQAPSALDNQRLLAVGASSFAGLLLGMGLLIFVLVVLSVLR